MKPDCHLLPNDMHRSVPRPLVAPVFMVFTPHPFCAEPAAQTELTAAAIVDEMRRLIMKKGGRAGYRGLTRVLRIMDDNGNKKLDKYELQNGIQTYGLHLNAKQMDEVVCQISHLVTCYRRARHVISLPSHLATRFACLPAPSPAQFYPLVSACVPLRPEADACRPIFHGSCCALFFSQSPPSTAFCPPGAENPACLLAQPLAACFFVLWRAGGAACLPAPLPTRLHVYMLACLPAACLPVCLPAYLLAVRPACPLPCLPVCLPFCSLACFPVWNLAHNVSCFFVETYDERSSFSCIFVFHDTTSLTELEVVHNVC